MKHFASPSFWFAYEALPSPVRVLADKNFELLKADPKHPALHFKHVGAIGRLASVCITAHWPLMPRMGLVWFLKCSHADYDKLVG